ncbi:hypothetical protein BJV77DRAFT_158599 [Russula vinacea]|nr:hypothetical protein BJV77DRAFT_158599 [Russula vinacea]
MLQPSLTPPQLNAIFNPGQIPRLLSSPRHSVPKARRPALRVALPGPKGQSSHPITITHCEVCPWAIYLAQEPSMV